MRQRRHYRIIFITALPVLFRDFGPVHPGISRGSLFPSHSVGMGWGGIYFFFSSAVLFSIPFFFFVNDV